MILTQVLMINQVLSYSQKIHINMTFSTLKIRKKWCIIQLPEKCANRYVEERKEAKHNVYVITT